MSLRASNFTDMKFSLQLHHRGSNVVRTMGGRKVKFGNFKEKKTG